MGCNCKQAPTIKKPNVVRVNGVNTITEKIPLPYTRENLNRCNDYFISRIPLPTESVDPRLRMSGEALVDVVVVTAAGVETVALMGLTAPLFKAASKFRGLPKALAVDSLTGPYGVCIIFAIKFSTIRLVKQLFAYECNSD